MKKRQTRLTKMWRTIVRGDQRTQSAKAATKAIAAWPAKQARLARMEAARRAGKVLRFDAKGNWIE